ncbi:hypothetical protein N7481_007140 [Penicillium waksmanii]|uniref:uncharacterized protein n=1 Tax=Penicillium waksmanii TaxID=69791 RepID=UPI002548FC26|nr:uncharacterized protein N7481_007140 [Penicillium waksmanii]KAJ5979842.1 hypothetical protein N7481_007140 [Penicillium waksmanii]
MKCPEVGHQLKWHVHLVMIGGLNVIEVKVSRVPTVELPNVIVSRSSHGVDGIIRKRKLPLIPSQSGFSSSAQEYARNEYPPRSYASGPPNSHYAQEQQQEPCFPAQGPNGKTPYIGDSSNLNYLVQQFGNPFRGTTDIRPLEERLQGAMLARLGKSTEQEIRRVHSYTTDRLQQEGAFDLPPLEISGKLLNAYFFHSLASLPVIDRSQLLESINQGTASNLLLNAIYLASTIYCSDETIADAGFVSRYVASLTFYRRAKSLYDAGYENDAVATIQATFLMCYWWSGILEPKDTWYWLGISVGMAQALGMHQEKSYMRLSEKDRKVWRRLWWMVYAMDVNLSMLLDRPPRVQGRLCNVKPLAEDDFEQPTDSADQETFGETLNAANRFTINAVQLARIAMLVDQFYTIKFDETNSHSQDVCLDQISRWSSSLPAELQNVSMNSSPWAMITNLLYQEYRLLLHRSNPRFSHNTGPGTPTFEICTQMFHILEFIVANDLIYPASASIVAPILSILSIYIVNIHRGDAGIKMISENRARFCMVILEKLLDRFPVVASFYPIYEALLKRYAVDVPAYDDKTRSGGSETGHPSDGMTGLHVDECDAGNIEASGGSILQDSTSGTFPFPLPFGNLFEEFLLSSPPPKS